MLKSILAAGAAMSLLGLVACNDSGGADSAEEAGQAADTAYEQGMTGQTNMGDGPAENAGEAIDEQREKAADVAEEAHENAPATPPPTTP